MKIREDVALLTELEAATMLRLSERTLRYLRAEGKVRYVRTSPRRIRYRLDDIEAYIANQTVQDAPPCPSTNTPRASSGTMISSSRASAITEALAARRSGMRRVSRQR